jgi:hypothetical protein
MAFVIDGLEWCFDEQTADDVIKAIENLLVRVRVARERREKVWIGDDLQTKYVLANFDLWSLCAPGAPIKFSSEIVQELAAWLGSAPRYLDEEWPDGLDVTLIEKDGQVARENSDLAWAHHKTRSGQPVGCLSLYTSKICDTKSSLGNANIHYIKDESAHRFFWRLGLNGGTAEMLERFSPNAFPDIYFCPGIWRGFRGLAGGYLAIRDQIWKYLCVLDDYGRWIFCAPNLATPFQISDDWNVNTRPSNQLIERRFKSHNLEMTPENPNVFKDKTCREAREISIDNKLLYCEWHGKLEPHRNRLYVHPPIFQSNWKVIMAIAHEHLPLP